MKKGLPSAPCLSSPHRYARLFYTTNAIESLNSGYRRLNRRQRSVFLSSNSLRKSIYLATFELTKKWTGTLRNWGPVHCEMDIMYPGRLR